MSEQELMTISIEFHEWMKDNDCIKYASQYFGYTDEDMFIEFYKQYKNK